MLLHTKYFFKTIIQSLYEEISQNSIRTRDKISKLVIKNIRTRSKVSARVRSYPHAQRKMQAHKKWENLQIRKDSPLEGLQECSDPLQTIKIPILLRDIAYFNTLNRTIPYPKILVGSIPYLNTLSRTIPYLDILSRTIPYLNTLSRTITYLITLTWTIPYLNTLSQIIPYSNTLSQIHSDLTLGSQSNSNITLPESSANESRVLRRQTIRSEYYVTRELSARVEVPSLLSNRFGSQKPILIHFDLNPPSDLLTHVLLTTLTFRGSTPILSVPCWVRLVRVYRDHIIDSHFSWQSWYKS